MEVAARQLVMSVARYLPYEKCPWSMKTVRKGGVLYSTRHLLLEVRFFGKVVCNVKNIPPSIGMIVLASLEIRPFHDEQLVLSTGGRAVACCRLF